jgi:hypothetical protein
LTLKLAGSRKGPLAILATSQNRALKANFSRKPRLDQAHTNASTEQGRNNLFIKSGQRSHPNSPRNRKQRNSNPSLCQRSSKYRIAEVPITPSVHSLLAVNANCRSQSKVTARLQWNIQCSLSK